MIVLDQQPFGTQWLFLLDTVRVVTIILDVWLIVWIMVTAQGILPPTRQWGCLALSIFMVGSIWSSFVRIGEPLGVTLVTAIAGTICAAIYITQVRGTEKWKREKARRKDGADCD